MATKAMLGRKVRRLRQERRITQVDLARALGISASYLNLIEHNQRPLPATLLMRLADRFEVEPESFSGGQEARLRADLRELFSDPLFGEADLGEAEIGELVEAVPAVGQALLTLYTNYRATREEVQALGERLSSESFLSTSPHELRTLLTSIRSFSEILMDYDDLESAQRRQFLGILVNETQRLSLIVNQMLSFAAEPGSRSRLGTSLPAEAVADFFQAQGNYFDELEAAAAAYAEEVGLETPLDPGALAQALRRTEGIAVALATDPAELPDGRMQRFDAANRLLWLSEVMPRASRTFHLGRRLALVREGALLDRILAEAGLESPEAQSGVRSVLAGYYAAALMMPYGPFLAAARSCRHNIDRLQARFHVSFEQACQRLASLNRPGDHGVPFHFLRVDIAGNVSKRFTADGLQIARFSGVCPRMAVHQAFLTPERIITQIESLEDGRRFFEIARSVTKSTADFRAPPSRFAVSLGCDLEHAGELVYADGLALDDPASAVPVGVSCGLCERRDCGQRAAPPFQPGLPAVTDRSEGPASDPARVDR